jgi:hypothetical protein
LEAVWNEKLRALEDAREQAERKREEERTTFDETTRQRILKLTEDLPEIWHHPDTLHRERKRIAALIIEDVTLLKKEKLDVHVRFRGGATTTLTLPHPLTAQEQFATKPEVLAEIDAMLEGHTNKEVIAILNERGHRTGMGKQFNKDSLSWVMYNHGLKSQKQRLSAAGFLSRNEMADALGCSYSKIKDMQSQGLFLAKTVDDSGEWSFNPIAEQSEKIRQLAAEHNKLIKSGRTATSTGEGVV